MIWTVLLVAGMLLGLPVEQLIDARTRAYDANFRNDAAALKKTIGELSSLTADHTVSAMALYYAAWTEWMLASSELESGNKAEAIHTAERSVGYARRAL